MKAWSVLPRVVRAPLIPLGRRINPRQRTAAVFDSPGHETVAGVADLRAQGFEPIEEYTGAVGIGQLWPQHHRRSVAETRSCWLGAPGGDGRLWMVRSPWPSLSLRDSLDVVWTWVERDHESLDTDRWRERVSEALTWDETAATRWHRQAEQ
jgi:hypothetical protein